MLRIVSGSRCEAGGRPALVPQKFVERVAVSHEEQVVGKIGLHRADERRGDAPAVVLVVLLKSLDGLLELLQLAHVAAERSV